MAEYCLKYKVGDRRSKSFRDRVQFRYPQKSLSDITKVDFPSMIAYLLSYSANLPVYEPNPNGYGGHYVKKRIKKRLQKRLQTDTSSISKT